MTIVIFLSILFVVLCLFSVGQASLSLAPWLPTKKGDFARICRLADMKPGEVFYDLGCGDGRLLSYAARHYGVRAIGLELSLPFYFICQIRRLCGRWKNVRCKYKNLYRENLADADVVYIFAESRRKFKGALPDKLKSELRPGSRVITYVFPIAEWTPDAIDKPGEKDLAIYRYKIKR